jgi:2-polyprenyl-6-methoxyphenol hydroxylase-like FAD-dependent oxidoreductase
VLGGSIAGLLAARALLEHHATVTVVDRDARCRPAPPPTLFAPSVLARVLRPGGLPTGGPGRRVSPPREARLSSTT